MNALAYAEPAGSTSLSTPAWAAPRVAEADLAPCAATAATGAPARLWGIVRTTAEQGGLPWHGAVLAARLRAQEAHRAREAAIEAGHAADGPASPAS